MPQDGPDEAAVDRLYQLPLEEFVSSRNQLARQRRGAAGGSVRSLQKPNTIAWALNQVYWSARPVFDRLLQATAALREAQAAVLAGRPADLRGAGAAHREAIDAAVRAGTRALEASGHDAGPETMRSLTAAFEALPWETPPGRLTRPPSPRGFGALAGLPVTAARPIEKEQRGAKRGPGVKEEVRAAAARAEAESRSRREADARRERTAAALEAARRELETAAARLREAELQLDRAREADRAAREEEQVARERLQAARDQAARAKRAAGEAEAEVGRAGRDARSAEEAVRKAEASAARRPRSLKAGS